MKPPIKRCAVYTRKSSEEGLSQEFNSLDAQREAGEAYVKSQNHEGWRLLPGRYDDGGYSGGSMERPGLKRLLTDIEGGTVDVVVVYKIDRLTRSLADFARMVELFDRHKVSFVSVTQSFNTTSSMGRLTLNVLLSFAQFEREVTGERIRDKIAASKAKGMWMGGVPPLGYDLPTDSSRTLVVNDKEAEIVRSIFRRYLELRSVHRLQHQLLAEDVRSKQRTTRSGRVVGGEPFSRGALFYLLRNRIYRGMIVHKGEAYPGAHRAIVDEKLFEQAQELLGQNAATQAERRDCFKRAPLTGRIFDSFGSPMSPSFSRGKSGKLYRYYVSAPLQQGKRPGRDDEIRRVPADALERLLITITRRVALDEEPLALLKRVEVYPRSIELLLPRKLAQRLQATLADDERMERDEEDPSLLRLVVPIRLRMRGGRAWAVAGKARPPRQDRAMLKALRAAHALADTDALGNPRIETGQDSRYLRRLVRLAFLAPDIQEAIVNGRQPSGLLLEELTRAKLPTLWSEQRRLLGFAEEQHP